MKHFEKHFEETKAGLSAEDQLQQAQTEEETGGETRPGWPGCWLGYQQQQEEEQEKEQRFHPGRWCSRNGGVVSDRVAAGDGEADARYLCACAAERLYGDGAAEHRHTIRRAAQARVG